MIPSKDNLKPRNSATPADAPQFGLHTVITALRCWWLVAAPLGLLLAVVAGGAVYFLVKPTYTAAAWLIIRDSRQHLLKSDASDDDSEKFVQNQLELMRSPSVIDPVSANPEVASTPELARELDPAKALQRLAKIRAVGKSEFYVVEFTSVSPDKAVLVANELANKFLDLQTRDESERSSFTIGLLKQRLVEQESSVKTLRENVQTLAIQRTGKNPFDTRPKEDLFIARSPLAELQSQLIAAEIDAALLQAQVQVESELLEKQPNEVPQREIDRFVEEHPRVAMLRGLLEQVRTKLQDHERSAKSVEHNDLYQQMKKKIAEDQGALDKVVNELRANAKEELLRQVRLAREDEVNALRRRQSNAQLTVQILKEKFDAAFKNQKEYTGDTLELEFKRADYDRASAVHQAISDRILTMETEQKAPERVKSHQKAKRPSSPDEAVPYKKMLMAALGAFLLPFGLAVGVEQLYRRVSNRDQLESAGGMAVVGEITVLPRRSSHGSGRSRKANRELQLFQETVDGLRTALTLGESLQSFKVLAVTSAVSREGKTSLGVQLAMSVAKATGERTLLIDGDMRSPDLHRIFDLERSPGLAELLEGKCSIEDAIKTAPGQAIDLLPAGKLSVSPHRMVANGKFERLINELRKTHTHIILDTPPILSASEVLIMARVADMALLCVRRDFSRVRQVADAFSRLQKAGVKTAGAVLGGIPPREYTYRYGSYYVDDRSVSDGANSAGEDSAGEDSKDAEA